MLTATVKQIFLSHFYTSNKKKIISICPKNLCRHLLSDLKTKYQNPIAIKKNKTVWNLMMNQHPKYSKTIILIIVITILTFKIKIEILKKNTEKAA